MDFLLCVRKSEGERFDEFFKGGLIVRKRAALGRFKERFHLQRLELDEKHLIESKPFAGQK